MLNDTTTQRSASRADWLGSNSTRDIDSGSLQRIADATEKMAQCHTNLIFEKERYRKSNMQLWEWKAKLQRSNSALRGVITKLQRRLADA